MERSKHEMNRLKFFRINSSADINIERADIFYRKKYNEIINYLKTILTEIEDSISNNFLKFINPKGCLLINVNPGNDIELYLKLISKNYQLNIIELDHNEIIKNPKDFLDDFTEIIQEFIGAQLMKGKRRENSTQSIKNDNVELSKENYSLFIINEYKFPLEFFKDKYLLSRFINYFEKSDYFLKNKIILVWINSYIQEIVENHHKIYNIFDLFIKIPVLDKVDREELLKSFSESNPKLVFDIKTIVENTQEWEVEDLYQLLKVGIFKHFLNSELNDSSNEITDILLSLIKEGEFIPSYVMIKQNNNKKNSNLNFSQGLLNNLGVKKGFIDEEQVKSTNEYINQIHNENISEFMLQQLYENAASKHYNELIIVIDKLSKNEILEDYEKKLLGKYPFILNDKPKMVQIHLEKAKKRIDQILKVFGKDN